MNQIHVVERAYQLARTPECQNTGDVVKALSAEGYSGAEISHFQGSSIRADLNRICKMPAQAVTTE
jgi:tRNA G26 N,N-dimethylase Trm1